MQVPSSSTRKRLLLTLLSITVGLNFAEAFSWLALSPQVVYWLNGGIAILGIFYIGTLRLERPNRLRFRDLLCDIILAWQEDDSAAGDARAELAQIIVFNKFLAGHPGRWPSCRLWLFAIDGLPDDALPWQKEAYDLLNRDAHKIPGSYVEWRQLRGEGQEPDRNCLVFGILNIDKLGDIPTNGE